MPLLIVQLYVGDFVRLDLGEGRKGVCQVLELYQDPLVRYLWEGIALELVRARLSNADRQTC